MIATPPIRTRLSAAASVFAVVLIVAAAILQADGGGADGRAIFRYDTFGDEQLWTNVLRMHEAVSQVDPATALAVGLKVDVDALPPGVIDGLRAGTVDLHDPTVTTALLQLNAVVGIKGTIDETGRLTTVGV